MRYQARWTSRAVADLRALDLHVADRITKKVEWFIAQEKPLAFAKPLGGSFDGILRFRIGEHRVLFEVIAGKLCVLMILRIKHRREAYE